MGCNCAQSLPAGFHYTDCRSCDRCGVIDGSVHERQRPRIRYRMACDRCATHLGDDIWRSMHQ